MNSYQEDIQQISMQIKELQQKQSELINKSNQIDEDKIKRLDWVRGMCVRIYVEPLYPMIRPKYKILFDQYQKTPSALRPLLVLDKHSDQENVYYLNSFADNCFYTNSSKSMIEFINNVDLGKIDYDESVLELLIGIRERNSKIEQEKA